MPEPDILLQADLDNASVLNALVEIEKHADQMAESGNRSMQELANNVQQAMDDMLRRAATAEGADADLFEQLYGESPEKFRSRVEKVLRDVRNLAKLQPELTVAGQQNLADGLGIETARTQFEVLEQTARQFLSSTSAEAQRFGSQLSAKLQEAQGLLDGDADSTRRFQEEMKQLTTETNKFNAALKRAEQEETDPYKLETAQAQFQVLQQISGRFLNSANEQVRTFGARLQEDLSRAAELLNQGDAETREFIGTMGELVSSTGKFNSTIKQLGTETNIEDQLNLNQAAESVRVLDQSLEAIATRGDERAQKLGGSFEAMGEQIEEAFRRGEISSSEFEKEMRSLAGQAAKVAKETTGQDITDTLGLPRARKEFENLQQTAQQFLSSSSEQAQQFGQALSQRLQEAETLLEGDAEAARRFVGEISTLRKEASQMVSTLKRAGEGETDLDKQFNLERATVHMQQLDRVTKGLLTSNDPLARQLGETLRQLGERASQAMRAGEMSTEEFNKEMRSLRSQANQLGNEFGTNVREGADRAQVSIWRLGTAAERLGVRGAGAAFSLVDALRGIPVAAAASVIAIAAVVAGLVKAAGAAVNLGKKIVGAFIEVNKGAVLVSEDLELIDRQLTNIFRGKEELARRTLRRILELSTDFGVDLTGEISRIFLPMVESFEQFEQLAEIASTLVIGFNRTDEEVSRALKQAASGHFRPLQEQFGLLQSDIDIIKQLQEEGDALEGVIEGMNLYLERSRQEWDTYEGTLRRVRGSLEQYRKMAQAVLGEPIRIAIVEELDDLLSLIDEKRPEIEAFLEGLGGAVAAFIEQVGGIAEDFLGDVDAEDMMDLVDAIDQLLTDIAGLGEQIFPTDGAQSMLDISIEILNTIDSVVVETRKWLEILKLINQGFKDIEEGGTSARDSFLRGFLPGGLGNLFGIGQIRQLLESEIASELDIFSELHEAMAEEDRLLQERIEGRRELLNASEETTDALDDEIDKGLAYNAMLQEMRQLEAEAAEASKILAEAFAEVGKELQRKVEDLEIEMGRRRVDIAIDASEKRIDAERKLQSALVDINQKHQDRVLEALIDAGDSSLDNFIKYQRKLVELEIDSSHDREDRERKHQERLKDIRERFAFDAQEALRMNDAVAFLRIKRRMEFELEQEKQRREEEEDQAVISEQRKREKLQREYQYQEEDIARSTERKMAQLDRRLAIELREEREKHEESLAQIKIWEDRKLKELDLWQKRQVQDIIKWHERKIADTIDKYEDEIAAVEEWENAKLDIVNDIAQQMMQVASDTITQITAMFTGAAQQMGRFRGQGRRDRGTGSRFGNDKGDGGDRTQGGEVGQTEDIEDLRRYARQLVQQSPVLTDGQREAYMQAIPNLNSGQLKVLIRQLGGDPADATSTSGGGGGNKRHSGGFVTPGVGYDTLPEEGFNPVTAGIINPTGPVGVPNMAAVTPGITYDYSRPVSADVSLLDPTHLSPTQITMIRNLITEEILRYAVQ